MEYQCNFHDHNFHYNCKVKKIREVPGSKTVRFTGKHAPGKTNNDVESFEISRLHIESVPRNLHETFPNLMQLAIVGCGLKKISKADLIGLGNLEILSLEHNNLTSLPDDLFIGMRKLRIIDFDDNQLESLSSKLLKPIESSLELAYFQRNAKIDDYFHTSVDRNLKRLMCILDSLELKKSDTDTQTEPVREADFKANQKLERHQQLTSAFKVSGEFTDFTIQVRGKELKVHKAILAAQSPVFRQTFTSDDAATEKTFTKVTNFSQESFGSFLDYFYSGDISDKVNPLEVFELASVFEVATLKKTCTVRVLAALCQNNALDVYNLGHHHDSDQLKREAFKFIQQIVPEVPDTLVHNPDYVNKLVTAKCEFDAILDAAKNV